MKKFLKRILAVLMISITLINILSVDTFAKTSTTEIDLTKISSGDDTDHRHIYNTYFDSTYHWEQCSNCSSVINKQKHSMKLAKQTSADCSIISTYICSCGYSYQKTENNHKSASTWSPHTSRYLHFKFCTNCGLEQSRGHCVNSAGEKLGCATKKTGTCVICGGKITNIGHASCDSNMDTYNIYCSSCGESIGYVTNNSQWVVDERTTSAKLDVKLFGNNTISYVSKFWIGENNCMDLNVSSTKNIGETSDSTYNGTDYSYVFNYKYYADNNSDLKNTFGYDKEQLLSHFVNYGMKEGRVASACFNVSYYKSANNDLANAFGNDLVSYYNHYALYGHKEGRWGTSTKTGDYTCYATIKYNNNAGPGAVLNSGIYLGYVNEDNNNMDILLNFYSSLKSDNYAPRYVTSSASYPALVNNYTYKLTVNATYKDADTPIYIRLLKQNGEALTNWEATTTGSHSFDIYDEISDGYIYVQAKDRTGNISEKTKINIPILDSKAPTFVKDYTDDTEWTKSKDITFLVQDNGIGTKGNNVYIAFNDITGNYDKYLIGNFISPNKYSRTYHFVGDVYGTKKFKLYMKDSLNNETSTDVSISNIDNTAPTITNVNKSLNTNKKEMSLIVDANDINNTLKAEGIGVDGYAITSTNIAPTVDKFQSSNVFSVSDNGTYYLWAKDGLNNISLPKEVNVSELTIDITATINWNDKSNSYNSRPDYAVINLLNENNEIIDTANVTGSGDVWTYTFKDLELGTYYLEEETPISKNNGDKYTVKQDNYVFTNSLENNGEFSVSGTIEWIDDNDKYGYRPKEVTLTLYKDGVKVDEQIVDKNTSGYSFINLDKYNLSNGDIIPYKYTVEESFTAIYYDTEGNVHDLYEITVDGLNFTNTIHLPDKPFVPVKPDYNNGLTIKHNVDGYVDVTLKKLGTTYPNGELTYTDNYDGYFYNISALNGTHMDGILSGKYEIIVNESNYNLNSINITDNQYTSLSVENGKYYLIIQEVNKDTQATLVLDLEKKDHIGYQTDYEINNFWKTLLQNNNNGIAPLSLFSDYVEAPLPEESTENLEETEESTELETTNINEDVLNSEQTDNIENLTE